MIGMLPTGSGKTMVAAMLVRHMADDLIRTKRKVRTRTRLVPLVPMPAGLRSPKPPSRARWVLGSLFAVRWGFVGAGFDLR